MDPLEWAATRVTPVGAPEVVSDEEWAKVWRLPIAGADVFVKQCHGRWQFEPALTAALSTRWPDRVVEVLAVDPHAARMVLTDAGTRVGELGNPPELWEAVLPRYAELQQGEATHVDEHLRAGVLDLRTGTLPAAYESAVAEDLPLTGDALERLRAFVPAYAWLCAELASTGTGATVQHDDLHVNNLYRSPTGLRVVDWGDSSVAHPFFSTVVTFRFLEERNGLAPGDPWFARLRDAYLEPWGHGRTEEFALAQRVGIFAHVTAWTIYRDALDPAARPGFLEHFPSVLHRALARIDR